MPEKLAGRLTWERTANGIRVEIPAKRALWNLLFICVWLPIWTIGGLHAIRDFKATHSLFLAFWLIGWLAGEVYVPAWMIWSLFGTSVLELDPSMLNITQSIGVITFRHRSFAVDEMRNLRYLPAGGFGRSQRESAICFESGDKTVRFATGISDPEAFELIDKMLDIHQFPKERALEYIDLSR